MTSSLGLRLSWWLAVQSLVGLLIVSTIVYVVSSSSQDKRQVESLQQVWGTGSRGMHDGRAAAAGRRFGGSRFSYEY